MTSGDSSTRNAARVIALGATVVLALLTLIGIMLLLRGAAWRSPEAEWLVVLGTLAASLVGLIVIVYGLVQLARARRDRAPRAGGQAR
jgi:hypothetical protein